MAILFQLLLALQFITQVRSPQTQLPTIYFNQVFTLHQYNQVIISDSTAENRLVVSLGNILDSRCPADVLCIKAGTAAVNLQLSDLNRESATITLDVGGNKHMKPQASKSNSITLAGATYTVTVLDVMPYPTATGVQLSKNIRIIVAKL